LKEEAVNKDAINLKERPDQIQITIAIFNQVLVFAYQLLLALKASYFAP